MEIRKRILKYIDSKGISKYKFYQEIGVANGFLDKDGAIGSDKCEKISYQYPDLSLEWLITGKGEMLKIEEPASKENPMNEELLRRLFEKDDEIKELKREIKMLQSSTRGNTGDNVHRDRSKKIVAE